LFYILYGKDTFSRHQKLGLIKSQLGDPAMLDMNTNMLSAQQLTIDQVQNACNTIPFLSPFRLVIIEGLLERFELKPDSALKDWYGLADYVKQMPETTVLVLIDGEIKEKKNQLLKALAASAEVSTFPEPKGKGLRDWILVWVKNGGGTITSEAVNLLAELIGGDLWAMGNEIDKLLDYSARRHITDNDVRQVTSNVREASIFALVDAILERNSKTGQRLLHNLLQSGASPAYIISMITRQLRLIVIAKDMREKVFAPEVRNKLERTSDYSLEKALQQAKAYTSEHTKRAYHLLLDADIAIKTGRKDGDLALNLLVIEMCRN